jgi:methylmalonyl-CoA/ethylmalonyl-CoA epimerase
MTPIRRLDHIAIAVLDTEKALRHFCDHLGLAVAHSEVLETPLVRLTYLDVGNAFLQLVEPLDEESDLAVWIAKNGEGIHHICFGVDDAMAAATALAPDAVKPTQGSGRGRVSAFVPGEPAHGVRIECTQFDVVNDVELTPGWLVPPGSP